MHEKNIKLCLAYDGHRYHGWQRQKNGVTIQGIIEEKIKRMLGKPVKLIASGRTDAGVHAVNQVCNFITQSDLSPHVVKTGLNSLLPSDILIKTAEYVPLEFHARFNAKNKAYEYRILNGEEPDIFTRRYLWHIRTPLDTEEMARALSLLLGRHDFSSFRSSGSDNKDPVRLVTKALLHGPENKLLRINIEAEGFLRHMVRNIVGTVVEVGLGKMDRVKFKKIFEARDRRLAGVKAPPQGLFLVNVQY